MPCQMTLHICGKVAVLLWGLGQKTKENIIFPQTKGFRFQQQLTEKQRNEQAKRNSTTKNHMY